MVGGLKRPQNFIRGRCVDWFDFYNDFKILGLEKFFEKKIDFFLDHCVQGEKKISKIFLFVKKIYFVAI